MILRLNEKDCRELKAKYPDVRIKDTDKPGTYQIRGISSDTLFENFPQFKSDVVDMEVPAPTKIDPAPTKADLVGPNSPTEGYSDEHFLQMVKNLPGVYELCIAVIQGMGAVQDVFDQQANRIIGPVADLEVKIRDMEKAIGDNRTAFDNFKSALSIQLASVKTEVAEQTAKLEQSVSTFQKSTADSLNQRVSDLEANFDLKLADGQKTMSGQLGKFIGALSEAVDKAKN